MQKNVFCFQVSPTELRYADPFAVERTLDLYLGGDPQSTSEAIKSEIPEVACRAMERLKAASCAAFGLPPFDPATGQGTDEQTVMGIFNAFSDWRQKKNLTAASLPTLPPSTAPEVPAPPGGWNSIMSSLMDCGCTETASSTSAPTP